MLLIVRVLDLDLKIPTPESRGGIHFMKVQAFGLLARFPKSLVDKASDRCARLSKAFLGDEIAIAIRLDSPADFLNGRWISRLRPLRTG